MEDSAEKTDEQNKEFNLPKEDTGTKIRNSLVSPKTALDLLAKHYKGKRVSKDFIEMASKDIDKVVKLSKSYRKKRNQASRKQN